VARLVNEKTLSVLLVFCLVAVWIEPLNVILRSPDKINPEYSYEGFEQMQVIALSIKRNAGEPEKTVVARKAYLSYFAGQRGIAAPYTDYDGLVKYLSANNADFLFLERRMLEEFPFVGDFSKSRPPDRFELVTSGVDSRGMGLELYRFLGPSSRVGILAE